MSNHDTTNLLPDDGQWREEIVILLRAIVREELEAHEHKCRFEVEDKDVKEFGHFLGMVQNLGDGKIGSGVEEIRDNHKWMKRQRERSDKLSLAFTLVVATTLTGGFLTALWIGLKVLIGKH